MSAPVKVNMKEVATDGASMLALDVLNNLKVEVNVSTVAGTGAGLALWQFWGKEYLKKNLQSLSLKSVLSEPAAQTEAIVELDTELLLGLKGGLYSASVYIVSLLMKGRADKMNLVDAVLMGYGGAFSGALVRSSLASKQ